MTLFARAFLAAAVAVFCSFAGFAEGGWRVSVDGRDLQLRTCRAEVQAPYQFGSFEVKGGEEVVVTAPDGTVEKFLAEKPFKRIFDPDHRRSVLILFGDAPETDVPDRNDPKVRWFGPGEHKAGAITLTDGETLYLARGAVVHGGLYARGRDIRVTGRGILTGVDYPKCKGPFAFFAYFDHCTNLVVRGVTLTEPYHWTLAVSQSRKVLIEDVRLCCGNILNDDGIDLMNASEVTIRNAFVRTQDDAIAVKGMDFRPVAERSPCEDILVEDSTLWVDRANVFRIGYESNASAFRRLTFRGIDVHAYSHKCRPVGHEWAHAVVWLQPSNGLRISDVLFEDLRVRSDGTDMPLVIAEPRVTRCFKLGDGSDPYSGEMTFDEYTTGGSVDWAVFRRLTVVGERGAFRGIVHAAGRSPSESVRGLRFEDCARFDTPLTAQSPNVTIGAFAEARFAVTGGGIVETSPVSRMDSKTGNYWREPGVFGEYWWANRFLAKHNEIDAWRGKAVDVVLLGDSIMHFWEWKHPASWGRFTEGRHVLNLGYGGDRTETVIWRILHGELDGYHARTVVLMIGTNNNTAETTDPANVAKGVERIVALIRERQPEARIVLHPIFPRGVSAQSGHAAPRARNERTNALLKAFADKDGEIVWVDFNDRFLDASGWVPKTLMADEIHPTDAGYDLWMDALAPVL